MYQDLSILRFPDTGLIITTVHALLPNMLGCLDITDKKTLLKMAMKTQITLTQIHEIIIYIRCYFCWLFQIISRQYKMKKTKYYTVGAVQKSNRKIMERGQIYTPNTHIHDHSLY